MLPPGGCPAADCAPSSPAILETVLKGNRYGGCVTVAVLNGGGGIGWMRHEGDTIKLVADVFRRSG